MAAKPFAQWWMSWFGLDRLPDWFSRLWPLKNLAFGDESEETTTVKPAEEESLNIRFARKSRKCADEWPTRKGKARDPRRKAGRGRGWMITWVTKAVRRFNPERKVKMVEEVLTIKKVIRCGNVEMVHTLDFKVSVNGNDRVYRKITNDQGAITGYLIIMDTSFLPAQDAVWARAEQQEKMSGLGVTNGLKKPVWMAQNEWVNQADDPLFKHLDTDWTSAMGLGNPDLQAKFSLLGGEGRRWRTATFKTQTQPARRVTQREVKEILQKLRQGEPDRVLVKEYAGWRPPKPEKRTIGALCPELARRAEKKEKRKVKPWLERR